MFKAAVGGGEVICESSISKRFLSSKVGVLLTGGVCHFGKLNYYLGKRAKDEGRTALV
jgi:hypothetical protein